MQTEIINVTGMTSETSTADVIRALTSVGGVQSVKVSYADDCAIVEFDDKRTVKQALLAALADAGFDGEIQLPVVMAQGSCCGGCCS